MTVIDSFASDGLPPLEEWPDLLIEPLGYPQRLNCAAALLDETIAAGHGGDIALLGDSEVLTYDELRVKVDRICHVLVGELGIVSGNRVLLRAPNNPTLVACWLAVAKAGGIVVATMPLLRRKELTEVIEHAEIGLALCDDRLLEELAGACERVVSFAELAELAADKPAVFDPVDTAADDVVLIGYTSGTSGTPKGTLHFHRDVLAVCDSFSREVLRPNATDVFIGSPPIAFTFGLGGLVLFPMRVGAASVLLEQAGPDELLAGIERHRATICFTAPTAYRRMLSVGVSGRVESLRRCVSAGEALPATVYHAWLEATGIRLIDGIGATEMLHIFISAADDDISPGATGRAVPGYEARVVDEQMRDVEPGTVGRLAVRGPTGCRYLNDPRQRDYVRDGWNLTGDAYVLDEDGYFIYQARLDDMIVSGGYNIAGPEVEQTLLGHAAVAECAVIGWPDEARGMIVKAFVVLRGGDEPALEPSDALARELQDYVKAQLAPYKYPRAIQFIEDLPRTETGKLRRYALRESGS
ncbi:MAG TPA: AMP-binding protein [Solirubrobacteraceae bacterium]|jgi:2-aminobenzoate-CoA ligase